MVAISFYVRLERPNLPVTLQAIPHSLTYTTTVFAGLAGLPYAQMQNKAGTPPPPVYSFFALLLI